MIKKIETETTRAADQHWHKKHSPLSDQYIKNKNYRLDKKKTKLIPTPDEEWKKTTKKALIKAVEMKYYIFLECKSH